MLNASNMSFALCPLLTQGAIEAIELNGSDALKETLPAEMVSGEWTGTMNLTEPQAGSDLAAVRTKADRKDGHYLISGQKIFITYGDHDLTDNIIHLVLARTPDAPEGVKGISLFVVPKFLLNGDGTPGKANDVRCVSLEHKLGIHASPTAVMSYGDHGGAIGYLVGEENRGLEYMFVMMNQARLSVGIQGLGIADRAYQRAKAYAHDRIQGRIAGDRTPGAKPIAYHPDVHRMLAQMRAKCEAMRAIAYSAAHSLDLANSAADEGERARHQARLDFLIPIVKGWCTESACEVASLALQVHGGMGFIEETGAAQHFRDARITTIYEGTTGIQANDLVGRKMQRDGGASAKSALGEIRAIEAQLAAEARRVRHPPQGRVSRRGRRREGGDLAADDGARQPGCGRRRRHGTAACLRACNVGRPHGQVGASCRRAERDSRREQGFPRRKDRDRRVLRRPGHAGDLTRASRPSSTRRKADWRSTGRRPDPRATERPSTLVLSPPPALLLHRSNGEAFFESTQRSRMLHCGLVASGAFITLLQFDFRLIFSFVIAATRWHSPAHDFYRKWHKKCVKHHW